MCNPSGHCLRLPTNSPQGIVGLLLTMCFYNFSFVKKGGKVLLFHLYVIINTATFYLYLMFGSYRSEVENLAHNTACDVIGLVTFVGRVERVKNKEGMGTKCCSYFSQLTRNDLYVSTHHSTNSSNTFKGILCRMFHLASYYFGLCVQSKVSPFHTPSRPPSYCRCKGYAPMESALLGEQKLIAS